MQGRKSPGKKSCDTERKKARAIFCLWVMDRAPLTTAEQTGAGALPVRPSRPPRRAAPSCVAKGGNLTPEPAETVLLQSRLVASSPSALSHSFCCSSLSHRGDWCKSLCVNIPSAANWRCWHRCWCPGGSVEAEVFRLPRIQRAPVCGWPCLHRSGSFPAEVLLEKSSSSPLFPAFPLALFPVGFQYAAVRSPSPCHLDGTPHF